MNMPVPKEALRELSRAGEAYRFLLSERDLAVLVLSENVVDCNEAACRLFGVARENFIGRSPLEFALPNQPDGSPSDASARERLTSALAGLPQWCTWQYRRQDGKLIDTIVHVEAVRVDGFRRVLIRIRDVSRLERAEVALAESETQMNQILDNTTTAIVFAKDLAGRYLFVNRAFERIVGLPQREIVGKTTAELFPEETADTLMTNDARVIAAGNTITVEENVRIGGQARTLLTNKFPLCDARGEPYAMCGIAADITERKLTEEALRRAALAVSVAAGEDVFRGLVGALATILGVEIAFIALHKPGAQDMLKMLAFQLDGKWIDDFEYPIAGTPCEEVIGQQYRVFPSQLGEVFALKGEFKKMGLQSYAGLQLNDAHGKSLGIMTVLSRRPLPDPDLVESMLKIFAARAVTEIERERANDALRASAEQYHAIFDASADGLVLFDTEARIVDSNPAFAELFGYPREALRAMSPKDLVAPESMAVCNQVLAVAADGDGFQGECRARRRDGSEFDVDLRGVPMQYMGQPHRLVVVRDITERRRADEQLRQSEARYRLLFEVESDAILLVDAETLKILDANKAAADLYGYTRVELLALEVTTLSAEPGDTASSIQRHTGSLRIPLRRHRRKDGTEILVEITSTIFHLSGRKAVLATIRDMTERRTREEALRRSDDRLRATVQAALDCIITMDAQGRIVEFNPAAEACFGYRRDEILGEVLADRLIPARHRDAHRRGVERFLVSGDGPFIGRRIEVTAMRANGSEFPAELAIAVAEGPDGRIFVGYLRDITERRQAIDALQSSEEQYRAIFNASTDALVLWNSELRRVDINPAYQRMYGFSRDEVLSENYPGHLPPESVAERKELIRRTLAGEPCHAELVSVRKDGGQFHIEVDTTPIRYRGEPHVLSVVRDITERKRAEAERGRLEAQLRQAQKMEAIGQLTGGIAHDFNNILTSILGYIVLGAERQSALGDAKLGKYLDQAQLAAQRARDLIQQMLTFSRGQRGERRALSLTPLVRESVNLLRSSLPATIELKMDLAAGVPAVMGDSVQVEQVLLNLCINARDAMTGAGAIRVGVGVVESADGICASCRQRVAGRFVELSVADAGAGIEPEVLDRMFEPFFTTKDVGRGSGMGLAMAHGIVHDHGGHIVVDTAPGRGTTFRLQFEPVEEARPAARAAHAERAPKHSQPRLSGRVLVVDDEEMVGEFMAEMLTNWGLEVTVKRNPVEAEVWYSHDPSRIDLVITDQTMPRLTGVELAKRLTGVRSDLPVILYTGYSDAVSDETMARSGIRALLKKPVDTDRLHALLRAHLPGARSAVTDGPAPGTAPKRARGKAPAKSSARTARKAPARKTPARGRVAATKRAAR